MFVQVRSMVFTHQNGTTAHCVQCHTAVLRYPSHTSCAWDTWCSFRLLGSCIKYFVLDTSVPFLPDKLAVFFCDPVPMFLCHESTKSIASFSVFLQQFLEIVLLTFIMWHYNPLVKGLLTTSNSLQR